MMTERRTSFGLPAGACLMASAMAWLCLAIDVTIDDAEDVYVSFGEGHRFQQCEVELDISDSELYFESCDDPAGYHLFRFSEDYRTLNGRGWIVYDGERIYERNVTTLRLR